MRKELTIGELRKVFGKRCGSICFDFFSGWERFGEGQCDIRCNHTNSWQRTRVSSTIHQVPFEYRGPRFAQPEYFSVGPTIWSVYGHAEDIRDAIFMLPAKATVTGVQERYASDMTDSDGFPVISRTMLRVKHGKLEHNVILGHSYVMGGQGKPKVFKDRGEGSSES